MVENKLKVLKRRDLAPGLVVRNRVSGAKGVVRADPDNANKIMRAKHDHVRVRTRSRTTGRCHYPTWPLLNVELDTSRI